MLDPQHLHQTAGITNPLAWESSTEMTANRSAYDDPGFRAGTEAASGTASIGRWRWPDRRRPGPTGTVSECGRPPYVHGPEPIPARWLRMTHGGPGEKTQDSSGIDVPKDHPDVQCPVDGRAARFENSAPGLRKLKAWLPDRPPCGRPAPGAKGGSRRPFFASWQFPGQVCLWRNTPAGGRPAVGSDRFLL